MVRLDATSTTCVSLWDTFHMIELVRFYLVVGLNTYLSFFFFFFEIPMGGEFVREYVNFSVKKNVYHNNLTQLIVVNLLVTLDLLLLLISYLLNTMVALALAILNKCYFDTLKNYFVYFNTLFYNILYITYFVFFFYYFT